MVGRRSAEAPKAARPGGLFALSCRTAVVIFEKPANRVVT